jgi:hypothetical protein
MPLWQVKCGTAYDVVHHLVHDKLKAKLKVPRPVSVKQPEGAIEAFNKQSIVFSGDSHIALSPGSRSLILSHWSSLSAYRCVIFSLLSLIFFSPSHSTLPN